MTNRHAALLWLSLIFGAAAEPLPAQTSLPASVEAVRSQLREGDIDAAIDAGEAAVETLADDAQAWFWLGRAYAQQAMRASLLGKPKWAGKTRDAYEKAVALDPEHLDARFDLTQYYVLAPGFLGGGRDKADAQVAELRRLDPVMGKLADAMLAGQDDKPAEVERAYREALDLAPGHPRARVAYTMFLAGKERWDDIAKLWNDSLARDPGDMLAHYQLGRLAAVSGQRLEEGLKHFEQYIASGQSSDYMSLAGAAWRRGQILEKLGRRDDALASYREAVRLQPSLQPAQDDLERLQDA
jgi:tetratricopeptide (TPR) repeat protein